MNTFPGLSNTEIQILQYLNDQRYPAPFLTVCDEALKDQSSTVSIQLHEMEKKGLVNVLKYRNGQRYIEISPLGRSSLFEEMTIARKGCG